MLVTIASLALAVVGVGVAIYFGLDNRKVRSRLVRFTWHDVEAAVKRLSLDIEADFKPDVCLLYTSPSPRDA